MHNLWYDLNWLITYVQNRPRITVDCHGFAVRWLTFVFSPCMHMAVALNFKVICLFIYIGMKPIGGIMTYVSLCRLQRPGRIYPFHLEWHPTTLFPPPNPPQKYRVSCTARTLIQEFWAGNEIISETHVLGVEYMNGCDWWVSKCDV